MINLRVFAVFLIIVSVSKSVNIKNINEWLVEYDDTQIYRAPAISGIYTAARSLGLIPENLFYNYNTRDFHWISNHQWQYSTNISDELIRNYENVNLVTEGVDLFSRILFNRIPIATTNNMFARYIINITTSLQENNNIKLLFTSPTEEAERLHLEQNQLYRIPQECPPEDYHGDCYVNLIRKMQASFSWDWGPAVPSVGIWKPVYIEAYNESLIRDVITHVDEMNSTHWELLIDLHLAENKKGSISGYITMFFLGTEWSKTVAILPNKYGEFTFSTKLAIDKSLVRTWWPNGYGQQPLYDLKVSFSNKNEASFKTVRVGFRKIELVQDKIQGGLTFYFKVNNIPIFMKGTNLIPIDLRPELGQNGEKIGKLLSVARDQHMNMIRVWGGGVYESDYLYKLADEYGLLIWQDFMFACSLYPSSETFLSDVLDEVRTQVKRIYHHPSLALFSGNNENEGALMNNWYNTSALKTRYQQDYQKLYIDTIKTEYLRLTHNKGIFLTSSPTNGKKSDEAPYGLSDNPQDYYYGDVHFYDYISDSFDPNTFPITRFTSEYGYQSLPCAESFLKDTDDEDNLNMDSEFMRYRQHHPNGTEQMKAIIQQSLELPKTDNKNYHKAVIYYSQIVQAVSVKTETERYRNYRSILTADGRGYTMGALYWQLNDVWTAPSWSGIDFYGRWKMLQYFVYDFFCPIIITGELSTVGNVRKLTVFVVTDVDAINNANATIQLYKYSLLGSIHEEIIPVTLENGKSAIIYTIPDVDKYIENHQCNKSSCFIYFKLGKNGKQLSPDNYVLLDKPKNIQLQQPQVQITSIKRGPSNNSFLIEVSSDMNALFVWLDAHKIDGRFSENGFLLVQAHKEVIFYCDGEVSDDEMKGNLTVTHLRDKKYFPDEII